MGHTKSGNKMTGGFLIFLGWLVYSVSYLGKVNYSANITQIIEFYNISKAEAGLVPSFFFFSYGAGQVINGLLCKKYNIKWMLFAGLFLSATINFIIGITTNFAIVKWLWMANGFSLSILWPTLIRLLAENLSQRYLGKTSVIMATTVPVGTLIIYGLSSLYAAFDNFKFAFYTAALAGWSVSVAWLFLYHKTVTGAKQQQDCEDGIKTTQKQEQVKVEQTRNEKRLFFVMIGALCLFAIGINLTKDGLITWIPSILKEEYGMSDSISILLTLLLPLVAIVGNFFALGVHKSIPDYVTHCFVIFMAMTVIIGLVIGILSLKQAVLMIVCVVVINLLATSLNSLLTSLFPMFMRDKVNSGLFAGILNGCCYVGSALSSYGLGFVADHFGWSTVFYCLFGVGVLGGFVWCAYAIAKRVLRDNR